MDDAGFILSLRTDPKLGRFLNPTSSRLEDQQAWLGNYFERANDHYFIIEDMADSRQGAIAIYDIVDGKAEWGRWVLRHGSLAALESAWMIYETGFYGLGLKTMYCRTMAENAKVVSFHDSFGAGRAWTVMLHGKRHVEHRIEAAGWESIRNRVKQLIEKVGRR